MNTLNEKNCKLIVRKIREAQKDIRQKTLALKLGQSEAQSSIESSLKPLIDPLEKIIKLKNRDVYEKELFESSKSAISTPKHHSNTSSVNTSTFDVRGEKTSDYPMVYTPEWDPFQSTYETPSTSRPISKINPQIQMEAFNNSIPEHPEKNVVGDRRQSASNLDYYLNMLHAKDDKIDKASGITFVRGRYYLNRVPIKFGVSNKKKVIEVEGKKINLSPGINELLFMRQPNDDLINALDVRNYKKIAELCAFTGDKKLKTQKLQTFLGKGLMVDNNNKIDYVYWDNPNELVNRLELLQASKRAGHTGHDNEIISIEEELREGGFIK